MTVPLNKSEKATTSRVWSPVLPSLDVIRCGDYLYLRQRTHLSQYLITEILDMEIEKEG
jgi:hypothetical protein